MSRVFILDNFDSFTWNLAHAVAGVQQTPQVRVVRRDRFDLTQLQSYEPTHLIISPGPGHPEQIRAIYQTILEHFGALPTLGVCLGHQCIAHLYGLEVSLAERRMHGKTSPIHHDGRTIFTGLSDPFTAMRYHSLIVNRGPHDLDSPIEVSAWTTEGEVMALRHKTLPLEGVQFHPESFATQAGRTLLNNFININYFNKTACAKSELSGVK